MTCLPLELTALLPLWFVVAGVVVLLLLEMFSKEEGDVYKRQIFHR